MSTVKAPGEIALSTYALHVVTTVVDET
jgi:hypothetical protein